MCTCDVLVVRQPNHKFSKIVPTTAIYPYIINYLIDGNCQLKRKEFFSDSKTKCASNAGFSRAFAKSLPALEVTAYLG